MNTGGKKEKLSQTMEDDHDHVEKAIKKKTHIKAKIHKKFQRRKMNENEQAINIISLKPLWDNKNAD